MSDVMSCVLKFHRTGHRMVPIKLVAVKAVIHQYHCHNQTSFISRFSIATDNITIFPHQQNNHHCIQSLCRCLEVPLCRLNNSLYSTFIKEVSVSCPVAELNHVEKFKSSVNSKYCWFPLVFLMSVFVHHYCFHSIFELWIIWYFKNTTLKHMN